MPTKEEIKTFSLMIEELAKKLRCNHIDAVLEHCNETGLEIEIASSLISSALKAKIREDAQDSNMIRKTSTLPL
jgi:hypothetical protein